MSREQQPNYAALAGAVRVTREITGWSQNQVASQGGPSDTTLAAIENNTWRSARPASTLAKLDTGLGWKRGTAAALLQGEDVSILTGRVGPPDPPDVAKRASFRPSHVARMRKEMVEHDLIEAEYQLDNLQARIATLREALFELTVEVDGVLPEDLDASAANYSIAARETAKRPARDRRAGGQAGAGEENQDVGSEDPA